jgi:hypothetical protein
VSTGSPERIVADEIGGGDTRAVLSVLDHDASTNNW